MNQAATAPAPPQAVRRYTRQARPCPSGGKNSYRTKRKARRVAEGLLSKDGIRLYVYRCHNCNLWHLPKERQKAAA